eukprot:g16495.t2
MHLAKGILAIDLAVGIKLSVRLLWLSSAWGWAAPTGGGGVNIALHAQSNYAKHGWVAGSEITTRGLQRAFEALDRVQTCQVFAPFSYDRLSSRKWDLVVIEGYTATVPAFIHEVRAANENVVVLFFCLDTYPSLSVVGTLDVDAFLTNSRVLLPSLQQIAPASALLHLAADPTVMLEGSVDPRYEDNVVYLGQFKNTKHRLVETLREVAPLGLSIYGNGWGNVEELLPFWRGVLPVGDIASLYTSAKVVLSTTETLQRSLGMVNNRVFEALSCGAAVVSDAFPAMEETFGNHVVYYRQPGDAARAAEYLMGNDTARRELGRKGRELVTSKHTYASRVLTILATMEEVLILSNSQASPAKTEDRLPAGNATEEPPGWVEAAAEEPAPEDSVGLLITTTCAETTSTVASPSSEGPPTNSAPAATANGTPTTVTTEATNSVPQGTCSRPPEEFPTENAQNRNATDGLSDRFPPMRTSRAASTKLMGGYQRDRRDDAAGRNGGDNVRGGSAIGGGADTARLSPSGSAPGLSTGGATRPNAPTVLVVYLSDIPPPEGWRRSVEAAAITVPGGARVAFLEVPTRCCGVNPDVSAAEHDRGRGLEEEERHRLHVLGARLSRLAAAGEETGASGVNALGRAAATEALGFMEWYSSVGMIAVYAEEGNPLEKHFLRHLVAGGEGASRAVRTAFFAAISGPSAEAVGRSPPLDQAPQVQWTSRYEWVEQFNERPTGHPTGRAGGSTSRCVPCRPDAAIARHQRVLTLQRQEGPCRELSEVTAAAATSEDVSTGPLGDGYDRDIPRLRTKIERVLFGMSRHASISVLEPREGTLLAALRNAQESEGDWAQFNLRVTVYHPFFRAPADGLWCVLLDGVEVGCRGDDDGDSARSISSLNITVEVDPRALPRRAALEAVLRGGALEAAKEVTRSPPVSVSIWF